MATLALNCAPAGAPIAGVVAGVAVMTIDETGVVEVRGGGVLPDWISVRKRHVPAAALGLTIPVAGGGEAGSMTAGGGAGAGAGWEQPATANS
jgi:hypothetical protein